MTLQPIQVDFDLYQGATFDEPITYKNPDPPYGDGLPIPITGKKFRMEVRDEDANLILSASSDTGEITIVDGPAGKLRILISAVVTAALPIEYRGKAKWYYDIEMVDEVANPDYVERFAQGKIVAYAEITGYTAPA